MSDSRVTASKTSDPNDLKVFSSQKIFRYGDSLIGMAGDSEACQIFQKWFQTKRKRRPKIPAKQEFEAIEVTEDGVYNWDETFARDKVDDAFYAVGSGAHAALGAMYAGADPIAAVEIAAMVDPQCGLPVQILKIGAFHAETDS